MAERTDAPGAPWRPGERRVRSARLDTTGDLEVVAAAAPAVRGARGALVPDRASAAHSLAADAAAPVVVAPAATAPSLPSRLDRAPVAGAGDLVLGTHRAVAR